MDMLYLEEENAFSVCPLVTNVLLIIFYHVISVVVGFILVKKNNAKNVQKTVRNVLILISVKFVKKVFNLKKENAKNSVP